MRSVLWGTWVALLCGCASSGTGAGATPPPATVPAPAAADPSGALPAPRPEPLPGRKDGYDPRAIQQLTSSYDEFKDRTATATSVSVGSGVTLYLFALSKGRVPSSRVTTMVLGVAEESEAPRHPDTPSLIFLIDGKRLITTNVTPHEPSTTAEGRTIETVTIPLTFHELRAFVSASVIRGQLDTTEFALPPQARSDIRAFAERVGVVTPAPSRDGAEYWLPARRSESSSVSPPADPVGSSAEKMSLPPLPAPMLWHRW